MPYNVLLFKAKRDHGYSPGHKDLTSARNFAKATMLASGADSFAIYEDGKATPIEVQTREPDAKRS